MQYSLPKSSFIPPEPVEKKNIFFTIYSPVCGVSATQTFTPKHTPYQYKDHISSFKNRARVRSRSAVTVKQNILDLLYIEDIYYIRAAVIVFGVYVCKYTNIDDATISSKAVHWQYT